jgi:DivIVA domain-containing protein
MALLTAEDVLNKAFSKTKYREGFDQDEVDDFLDEVANTIAQLTAERDEALARSGGAAAAAPVEAPPATAAGGIPGTSGLLAAATEPGGANPTGMLAMAQKLHDEYVQAGEAERDRIVDEAHAEADKIRERADEDAKGRMDDLAGERAELEGRIDDLRRFERDYRARLKAFLENLLGDLDHAGLAGAAEYAGSSDLAGAAGFGAASVAGAVGAVDATQGDEPETHVVEDASAYEEADAVHDRVPSAGDAAFPATAPVSFEDALAGREPQAAPQSLGAPESFEAQAFEAQPADAQSFEPQAFEPQPVEAAPEVNAPPSFDVTQPWESQLRAQADAAPANPFAPVTQPAEGEAASGGSGDLGDVPGVAAPEEGEEAPFTPPSSRMFNDLYGQQNPEQGH